MRKNPENTACKTQTPGRLSWLDFGRAAGMLVVLAVHAGASLGALTFYGGLFYMPVFFVAAGCTFRLREGESLAAWIAKKARRLLVPYFGCSAFLWVFFWLKDSVSVGNFGDLKLHSLAGILYSRNQLWIPGFGGENPVLLDLLNAPLWFLTALFLVYVFSALAHRSGRRSLLLSAGLVFSVLWHLFCPLLLPWSLEAVPYFACFFALGEEIRKRNLIERLCARPVFVLLLFAAFLLLGPLCGSVNLSVGVYGRSMLLYLIEAGLGSTLVFCAGRLLDRVCPRASRFFSCIGRHTLLILCLHMFCYMFGRAAAGRLGLSEGVTQILLVAGAFLLLPAAGEAVRHLAGKSRI